jgi:hypothetical protein
MFEELLADEKTLAALIALVGVLSAAVLSLYWNFRSAKSGRQLPFLNKQLEYCFEAVELAGKLAALEDKVQWELAKSRFFQLFWGPLAVVENDDVATAMALLALKIDGAGSSLPAHSLQAPALGLAHEVRKLLIKSWKIKDLNLVLEPREG